MCTFQMLCTVGEGCRDKQLVRALG
eukprot:COSAG01_NODE_43421_length_430_cov_0.613293_2_plen_24_part_01